MIPHTDDVAQWSSVTGRFTLAVCAEMVFLDLPLLERIERIHAAGFAAEIWGWGDKDAAALVATGAAFTSMTGYVPAT